MTIEEIDGDALETLVACTIAWSLPKIDGETVPCTPANARTVYRRFRWIRDQADAFVTDRANFLKASATP